MSMRLRDADLAPRIVDVWVAVAKMFAAVGCKRLSV